MLHSLSGLLYVRPTIVSTAVIGRPVEFSAVAKFLQSARLQPSALVIEGEGGIGKTTLWLAAVEEARDHGFRVLSARVGENETVLAYAALADLLGGVDPAVLTRLPGVQRIAVDRVRLRATSQGPPTDQRVVAAALVSAVDAMAAEAPVLVAIDDVQWLDASSQAVVAFAARRFKRRVEVLVTERVDAENASASWLQLAMPDAVDRIRVGPLRSERSPYPDLHAARPIPFPSHHGAHRRGFRWKSLLRCGTRQGYRC